jgi:hypothetical protein
VEEQARWTGDPQIARFHKLAPGSVSTDHRRVLLFAAAEYERIAKTRTNGDVQVRCNSKAVWLRNLADK